MRAGSRRGLDQATNKTTRRATTAVADAHALMLGAARAALEIAQLHRAGMGVGETIHGQRLHRTSRCAPPGMCSFLAGGGYLPAGGQRCDKPKYVRRLDACGQSPWPRSGDE